MNAAVGTECQVCMMPYSNCSCADVQLVRRSLLAYGGDLCDQERFHLAASVLGSARALGADTSDALLLECYCLAADGDVTSARARAADAHARGDAEAFTELLGALGSPEVAISAEALAAALGHAERKEWHQAEKALIRCTSIDTPAVRELRVLIGQGIAVRPRELAPQAPPPHQWSFHAAYAALILVAAFGGASLGGRNVETATQPRPPIADTAAAAPGPSPRSSASALVPVTPETGRLLYRFGRSALASRDTSLAIRLLSEAARAPVESYYVDDALYQLMLLSDARGERDSRSVFARKIAALVPASPYFNSLTRRFTGEQP